MMKLLFVLSRDFGELTNAICFAQEPEFESLLLVPPALYSVHGPSLPVPARPYQSTQEVLDAVERMAPDLVFLFSGYLYANNQLFSHEELEALVGALRQRRCRIVTSDPFFGMGAQIDGRTFSRQDIKPELFARAYALLKDLPHLYDVNPRGYATTEWLTYSPARMVRPPAYVPCPATVQQALGLDPARRRWVFLLASEDYNLITKEHKSEFHDLLTEQMFEVLNQGRQPVLVAPPACLGAVSPRCFTETQLLGLQLSGMDSRIGIDRESAVWSDLGDVAWTEIWSKLVPELTAATGGLVLVPFCRHDWFMSLVLDAEYVFYWNLFSNSVLVRFLNRLPLFFFDLGHLARASTALFERVSQIYYVAGVPRCLDLNQPLDAGELARLAGAQQPALAAMADNLLHSPTPVEVVRQLLHTGRPT